MERANPAYVRPLSADTMALTVTKISHAIRPETHILVNLNRFKESQQSVLRLWGPFCRWLVLVDDDPEEGGQFSNLLSKVRRQLEGDHRLIVVSMREEASFQDSFRCGDVSDESWDDLLLTKIRLNGAKRKCQLDELVSSRAELQNLLKHRLPCLVALAKDSGYVKLGQTMDPLPANYVPQQLVTRRYVKDEFFSSLAVRDVCIMDNSTYSIFTDKLSHLMKHYKECSFEELEEYLAAPTLMPILAKVERTDIITPEEIRRKYKGLHVYVVKHNERGWNVQNFLAGSGRIRRYAREQKLQFLEALDSSNNMLIVEGRPGVGKSAMLLYLAREVKQNNPSSWVVQINLRECYEKFEKHMSAEEVRQLLLQSVVTNEGELAELEIGLLQHCLQNYKNMVCLVDSFEEVCPDYAEKFIQALRLLSPRQGKLVVTTRPAAARLLEDHLGSLAHSLPAFSDSQLQKYFDQFRYRAPRMRIDTLTKPLNNLLRIPQLAEIYMELVDAGSYDIVTLCEAFFYNKLRKLNKEQFGGNLSDAEEREELENIWRFLEAELKRLARLLLERNEEISLQQKWPPVYDISVKAGIVRRVTGEMPLFVHRSFGEYFLAKWYFSDVSQNACATVYRSAHSGRSLEFFLEVFDRMVSRGCHLLSAVLDGDERRVRALLRDPEGLAERDTCGRNALHLAAAQGVESSLLRLLCEHMTSALTEEDRLMHWTPLQYAAKRGHWGAVEVLLQAGANLSQLGNIQDAVSLLLLKSGLRVSAVVQDLLVRIAEKYGHSKVLNMLWNIYSGPERRSADVDNEASEDTKDHKSKSRRRRTELHSAIQNGDEEKARKLIRAGTDLEVQDENGESALHYGAKAGVWNVVKLLIEAGASLEARDDGGRTALHCAARQGSGVCARLLVSAGAELDVRDHTGATPLHTAAEADADEVARALTQAGADLKARDNDGMSPLHYAALQGSVKCARLLVRKGASVHRQDRFGATPLHYAGGGKVADVVNILLEAGARLHLRDEDGMTALHYAADKGSAKCVWLLVSSGAAVNEQDNFGKTPLHYAVKANAAGVAKLLIDVGASLKVRDTHGKTALHYAAHKGGAECASVLVSAGADVNVRDTAGATPLHYAAEENATAVIELLVQSGARPHSRNEHGVTALHYAASRGSAKDARLLIRDIVHVNAPDKDGATPLHYAARAGNTDCASLLVRAGADIRIQDAGGLTALHYAARAPNPQCILFLIRVGSNVDVRDKKGATALHYAAMSDKAISLSKDGPIDGAAECIKLLLASRAYSGTRDEQGKTALHYAVSARNLACVALLIDAGCDALATDKSGDAPLNCAVRADNSICFTLLLRSLATNSTSWR
ncbi:uncharacterized protein LOC126210572 [Schistocerca nitens]|uniref:uncharacterized protein LOC126210572 n=1 Tax=Schistocerca nitens TaxID=7011 RepID=UPI002117CB93|nr:uncharacterized protein LOC126210572 [Schistocerca nitens]